MASELIKTLSQGDVLFAKGDKVLDFYLIKDGELGLFFEKENHLVPFQKVGPKEFLGESYLFSQTEWPWAAIVLSPTLHFVSLDKVEVNAALRICPNWVQELIKVLCSRLSDTEEIIRGHKIADDYSQKKFEINTKYETLFWRKLTEYRQNKS